MRHPLASAVPLLVVALAACADASTGPSTDSFTSSVAARSGGPGGASGAGGGQQGQDVSSSVSVAGSFTYTIPGSKEVVGYHDAPMPAAAGGVCGDGVVLPRGTWSKTTNGTTSVHPLHVHCTIFSETAEQLVTVTFEEPATYVVAPNGNLSLNIAPDCPTDDLDDPACVDRNIHYRANQHVTGGTGVLTGHGTDGSDWTLDLSQIAHGGNLRIEALDGILSRTYTNLAVQQVGGGTTNVVTIAW